MADTGSDQLLVDLIDSDAVVYGGYSAGACVLGPSLRGFELVDDITPFHEPIFAGLGVLDRPVVPHVSSPGHPETIACDALSRNLASSGVPQWALRDGDVLLVDGEVTQVLRSEAEPT